MLDNENNPTQSLGVGLVFFLVNPIIYKRKKLKTICECYSGILNIMYINTYKIMCIILYEKMMKWSEITCIEITGGVNINCQNY